MEEINTRYLTKFKEVSEKYEQLLNSTTEYIIEQENKNKNFENYIIDKNISDTKMLINIYDTCESYYGKIAQIQYFTELNGTCNHISDRLENIESKYSDLVKNYTSLKYMNHTLIFITTICLIIIFFL